jgi:hypothetical protein
VTIRSLNLQGVGQGVNGVNVTAAASVHLVDMNIYGFTGTGINVAVGATLTLTVEDTRVHDNGNGIVTTTTGGLITADYSRVSIWNAGSGVNAQNGSRVQIHNSTIVACAIGVNQTSLVALGSNVMVVNSSFTGNGTAVQSISGAFIAVSGNLFGTNGTVYNTNGGNIVTDSTNVPFGNGANGTTNGTITKI